MECFIPECCSWSHSVWNQKIQSTKEKFSSVVSMSILRNRIKKAKRLIYGSLICNIPEIWSLPLLLNGVESSEVDDPHLVGVCIARSCCSSHCVFWVPKIKKAILVDTISGQVVFKIRLCSVRLWTFSSKPDKFIELETIGSLTSGISGSGSEYSFRWVG